ncbi:13206_t:CDS:2 [Dentiscutata heterogama]|uniref:13206_t:CDS:1 n=1 Tax=Dentiscutata heterogama TaxID=1316150 RepID=A0ACA9JZZ2_9GLOM|nr:13206_t:CDS:2 [Dentiscutata heterogama]
MNIFEDLSLAVPIANSLTFIFTALAGSLLGEKAGTKGSTLIHKGIMWEDT